MKLLVEEGNVGCFVEDGDDNGELDGFGLFNPWIHPTIID